jgi:hypothetical protein
MIPPMDQEAFEGAMDQEAIEGAIYGTTDGSGSSRRSDGRYHRWIRERSKERWMVQAMQAMDQEEVVRTMDGASDGSESSRRSDGSGSIRNSDGSGSN